MNTLEKLFKKLDGNKIKYTVNKKFKKKLPKFKIPRGTNELGYIEPASYPKILIKRINLGIDKENRSSFSEVIRNLGFISFPSQNSYFKFDKEIGLLNVKIITERNTKPKKPQGMFVCFVGPEGGGKTATLSAVYTTLENFPVKRKLMNFSSFKESKLWRIYDLGKKLLSVMFMGNKLILADRYIYLTFRKNKILRKILKLIAVEPDIVFVMKSDYKTLKSRRGPICSSKENVRKTYNLFEEAKNKIEINTNNLRNDNLELIVNNILKLYGNEKFIGKVVFRV